MFKTALLLLVSVTLVRATPVQFEGILLPSRRACLSISVDARVREIRVQEGNMIKKGDVIALLYGPVEELDRDRAAVRLKKSAYENEVRKGLKASRAISDHDAVSAELDLELAKVELAQAEAVLREKTVTAPWDGRVLRIFKKEGESVTQGENLVEIVDYSTIHVALYLEARQLGVFRVGEKAEVVTEGMGPGIRVAVVEMIDPVLEPGSGLFRARLKMSNEDLSLPTGLPVKVRLPERVSGR